MKRIWIEVASGDFTLESKINGQKGLTAPKTKRYMNLLNEINKGDIILHYLTTSLSSKKYQSSFVAQSIANTNLIEKENKYEIQLTELKMLNNPVKLKHLKECDALSSKFKHALKMSMQAYIFEIENKDYQSILKLSNSK